MRSVTQARCVQRSGSWTTSRKPARPSAAVGETFVDVVCHDSVAVQAHTPQRRAGGDTFYFCSPFCARRFDATPAAYVPTRTRELTLPCCSGDDHAAA